MRSRGSARIPILPIIITLPVLEADDCVDFRELNVDASEEDEDEYDWDDSVSFKPQESLSEFWVKRELIVLAPSNR